MDPQHYPPQPGQNRDQGYGQPAYNPYGQPQQYGQPAPYQQYTQYGQTAVMQQVAHPHTDYIQPMPEYRPEPQSFYNKVLWPLATLTFISMVALGIVGFLLLDQRLTPDKTFSAFIENSLATKSLKQKQVEEDAESTVWFDVADMRNPKISSRLTINLSGIELDAEGYGTLRNTYVNFSKLQTLDGSEAPYNKKWIQIHKDGVAPADQDVLTKVISEPRYHLFGHIIFGNFSDGDKAALRDTVKSVYGYQKKQVTKDSLDGKDVFVYPVTLNMEALKSLNKKVAAIIGVPEAELEETLEVLENGPRTYKLYIRTDNSRIVQVVSEEKGHELVMTYSDFDATNLPPEPAGEVQYAQFKDMLTGISGL